MNIKLVQLKLLKDFTNKETLPSLLKTRIIEYILNLPSLIFGECDSRSKDAKGSEQIAALNSMCEFRWKVRKRSKE